MAVITMVAWAYLGDVTSFVPIGRELARRGHHVRFAVPEGFHDQLRSEPIELVPAGVQFSPRELAVHGDVVGQAMTPAGAMRASRFWASEFIVKHLPAIHDAMMAATADADLVLTHAAAGLCARIAAELRGLPWVTGHLFPIMLPTSQELPLGLPLRRADRLPPPRYARASWRAIERGTGALLHDRPVNAFRASFGLGQPRARGPVPHRRTRPQLAPLHHGAAGLAVQGAGHRVHGVVWSHRSARARRSGPLPRRR
jgi:UDP:flavonoid glycosyltransferase YjiC (YdhE family)